MSLVTFLRSNKCSIIANFIEQEAIEDQLQDFVIPGGEFSLFIPLDGVLEFMSKSLQIPLEKMINLVEFQDIIFNHFINKTTFAKYIHSINGNSFDFNGKYLDDNENFTIAKNTKISGNIKFTVNIVRGILCTHEQLMMLIESYKASNINFNILDFGAILTIVKNLKPVDILNLCKVNKQLKSVCNRDDLFGALLNKHYHRFLHLRSDFATNKALYEYLTKILTKKRFDKIAGKANANSDLDQYGYNTPLDFYMLLYETGGDHEFGVIDINEHIFVNGEYNKILIENNLFEYLFYGDLDSYKEGEIGRVRSLLNDIKDDKFHEEITELWDNAKVLAGQYWRDIIPYETVGEFIKSFSTTFEDRFQTYITEHTPANARKAIYDYEHGRYFPEDDEDNNKDFSNYFYDNDQIEFLQILHSAIRHNTLKIYDSLDFDFIFN